jgi:uncharacterized membrane protein
MSPRRAKPVAERPLVPSWPLVLMGSLLVLMPLFRYWTLHSSVADLGYFMNQLYAAGRDPSQWFYAAHGHLHGFFPLYALVYRWFPSPELLLAGQSALILLTPALLPISNSAERRRLGVVFLLCYAVWYLALFDFHFDHLVLPLGALFFREATARRFNRAVLAAVLVCLVKEPFALSCSMMGLYLLLRSRQYLRGGFLMAFGVLYFHTAVDRIIPVFKPDYLSPETSQAFGHLGASLPDMLLYPLRHPAEFVRLVTEPDRLVYLLAIFAAFGLVVVLFSPLELLPALPLLAIALLSREDYYHNIHFHYGAGLVVPFLMAFHKGWPRFSGWARHALPAAWGLVRRPERLDAILFLGVLAVHVALAPSPFSVWFHERRLYRHLAVLGPQAERDRAIVKACRDIIPKDFDVSVSTLGVLNFAHLAHRRHCLLFTEGVFRPHPLPRLEGRPPSFRVGSTEVLADYVTVDRRRPGWVIDPGTNTLVCVDPAALDGMIAKAAPLYDTVHERDGFLILRRKNARAAPP